MSSNTLGVANHIQILTPSRARGWGRSLLRGISACRRVHKIVCSSCMWPGPGFLLFLIVFWQVVEPNPLFVWLAPSKLGFQPLIFKATVEPRLEPRLNPPARDFTRMLPLPGRCPRHVKRREKRESWLRAASVGAPRSPQQTPLSFSPRRRSLRPASVATVVAR